MCKIHSTLRFKNRQFAKKRKILPTKTLKCNPNYSIVEWFKPTTILKEEIGRNSFILNVTKEEPYQISRSFQST